MRKTDWALGLMLLVAVGVRAQTSEPPPAKGDANRASDGVKPPKLVHAVAAIYPADPRSAGMRHGCLLNVFITADGIPTLIRAESAHPSLFDAAAIEAVQRSEFKPGLWQGNPVPVQIRIWVPFVPGKKPAAPEIFPVRVDREAVKL